MEIELKDFEIDLERDMDYCETGTLVLQVEPVIEDGRFSAHNEMGGLSTYGSDYIESVKVESAVFYSETFGDEVDVTKMFQNDTDWLVETVSEQYDWES